MMAAARVYDVLRDTKPVAVRPTVVVGLQGRVD
jgi:hypothetical protein